jgi:hypothetical protein
MIGRRRSTGGVTLMEVLIAVTLLSLLVVGMAIAMRVGLNAYAKTDSTLMDNRRVVGAQRVVEQELEGMMPLTLPCLGAGDAGGGQKFAMFQGEPQVMRLVSTFSLQQGWRGQPLLLELFVVPGAEGHGVRLVVNEIPYHPMVTGRMCTGFSQDPSGPGVTRFLPPITSERSFVLADKLAFCRFTYLQLAKGDLTLPPVWLPMVTFQGWPQAVRIEMAPLEADASRLQPITVTAPIRVHRTPEIQYGDF